MYRASERFRESRLIERHGIRKRMDVSLGNGHVFRESSRRVGAEQLAARAELLVPSEAILAFAASAQRVYGDSIA
jgi:hypothetical protein